MPKVSPQRKTHTSRGALRRKANEARAKRPQAGYVMPPWKSQVHHKALANHSSTVKKRVGR